MKERKNKTKKWQSIAGLALAVILMAAGALEAFGGTTSWTPPTSPMTVDDSVITVAARRAAQVSPEILGANVVATSLIGGGGSSAIQGGTQGAGTPLSTASINPMLGIFGTSTNANPDPYYYNFFYNSYAAANGLAATGDEVINIGGPAFSPAVADTNIYPQYENTSGMLYRRPDILLGTAANTSVDTHNSTYTEYGSLVEILPENIDSNPNNDYDPYLIPYGMTTTYDMGDTLVVMASKMQEIIDKSNGTKKTRYSESPTTIANNYIKYIKGIQTYVLSELDKKGLEKKVVAIIDPTDKGDGTFLAYNTPASSPRAAEYVENTTTNLLSVLGKTANGKGEYYLTAQELTQADVVITGTKTSATASALQFTALLVDKYGVQESQVPDLLATLPDCVYGISMQSAENAMGFGYFLGFVYSDEININPIYTSAYFYEKFFHVTDNSALQASIAANFANASKPEGMNTDLSNYNAADIELMIAKGMEYYEDNKSEFVDTKIYGTDGWPIDWADGIGSTYQKGSSGTPSNGTDPQGTGPEGVVPVSSDNNEGNIPAAATGDNSEMFLFLLGALSAAAVGTGLVKRHRSSL